MRQRQVRDRRGFTLIEITIVLSVIGGLVAAIFAAAQMVQARSTFNQAVDQLNEINLNMKNLYAGQLITYAALGSPPATPTFTAGYTTKLLNAQIFPPEMIAGGIVNNPWNLKAAANTAQVALVGSAGTPVQFVIEYNNLSADQCTDLVVRTSALGVDGNLHVLPGTTGLQKITVNGTAVGTAGNPLAPLPVMPIMATSGTACGGAAPFAVDWYYMLGS